MSFYDSYVKNKNTEQILEVAGTYAAPGTTLGEGEYLRVAAQIRSSPTLVESQNANTLLLTGGMEKLVKSLNQASSDSGQLGKKIVVLTIFLVGVGLLQSFVMAWPYLVWWWHNRP